MNAFTRRGLLQLGAMFGASGAVERVSKGFTARMPPLGGVSDVPDAPAYADREGGDWGGFRKAEELLSSQWDTGRNTNYRYDHDIEAMKSWAPWAKALVQRHRDYARRTMIDKLKLKFRIRD